MTSVCEKKNSAEVQLIHAEQISLYNFIVLRKKQYTQLKTKQLKQDINENLWVFLNSWLKITLPRNKSKRNQATLKHAPA